ncbi:MAG TPA: excinuclease ABC subunit C [Acidimicrobiaceae bacterium]|jgi:excinuclease ABC subunit C|nr:excinuclease ABC subunit C [Acidimicrobiaceae bacterium]HCV36624.1 excinuclease ABC subunit C [Acidimicrobiaceae bacterium]HJO79486.1 excinuclease ABC subunit UvrC [Acidimicrobiales bacterium]|tara:strand:+ start:928 stop:2790 length:1863 start_codon:yes stop_codon:yes gene_type:complete
MVKRPPPGTIPDAPGSYQFRDAEGRVLYVGKAKSLRQRLGSYFGNRERMVPRTAQMLDEAKEVEWIQVSNELEALMLEFNLIREHKPRFNVDMKDDKSYPFLAVTIDDEWPRPMVTRARRRKGVRYFGPYGHAGAIRDTLELLLRTFPLRTCPDTKFRIHENSERPCLLFHIQKCSGPCVGEIDHEGYGQIVAELIKFLDGDSDGVVLRLRAEMDASAEALDFESAARQRDRLASVKRVLERQEMVGHADEELDIFGVSGDDLEAAIQVFYVRHGRVVGRKGFVIDRVEDLLPAELIDEVVSAHYRSDPPRGVPRTVLVPDLPIEATLLAEWLSAERGTRVEIRVPKRGGKRRLLETVTRNANEEFLRHRLKRATDHNTRARALNELQLGLALPESPLRIECYDMSHLQGTDYVGSMVVFEDGIAKKSDYRRFRIRHVAGNDDYAAMEEVLTRRLNAYQEERQMPVAERPGRFAYPPNLLLVDGGLGQLRVAERVVAELGLSDEIPVAALAKRFEQVYRPGSDKPIDLQRGSEALYMLQRLRDESHRFAVAYHRQLRSKRMTGSVLDGIPGLGPNRKKRLTSALGGVKAVQRASLGELMAQNWLPDAVAEAIFQRTHGQS